VAAGEKDRRATTRPAARRLATLRLTAAGAPADTLGGDQIQVVDDVDHAPSLYPETPPGSFALFWKGGPGNWFVSASDGSATRDARTDDVTPPRGDSTRAYHVSETKTGTAMTFGHS